VGVKLRAGGVLQDLDTLVVGGGFLVRTPHEDGREHVGDGEDARPKGMSSPAM
jgi:hypothetical protein